MEGENHEKAVDLLKAAQGISSISPPIRDNLLLWHVANYFCNLYQNGYLQTLSFCKDA